MSVLPQHEMVNGVEYLVADTRTYVGNYVLWWAKDAKGYTTDIDRAMVVTTATDRTFTRETDRLIPRTTVHRCWRRVVDIQDLRRVQASGRSEP